MNTKRGDMPAMPLTGDAYTDYAGHVNKGSGYEPNCQGMTIREQMAMEAMQGYLAGKLAWSGDGSYMSPSAKEVAEESVSYADALLAELER